MNYIEESEQISFFKYLSLYPNYYALSNGSPLGVNLPIKQAVRLKAKGCKKDWPDIFIAWPSKGYNGFFIELKAPKPHKSHVTDGQEAMGNRLMDSGYYWSVAYGWVEAKDMWENYLNG